MKKLRMLPTILAAAFAFAAGPAQAEMKSQWVEYSHGDTKLKAYMAYDDKVSGKRPAGGPCARGHDAEDAGAN